jgi:hypothetical protein
VRALDGAFQSFLERFPANNQIQSSPPLARAVVNLFFINIEPWTFAKEGALDFEGPGDVH